MDENAISVKLLAVFKAIDKAMSAQKKLTAACDALEKAGLGLGLEKDLAGGLITLIACDGPRKIKKQLYDLFIVEIAAEMRNFNEKFEAEHGKLKTDLTESGLIK